MSSNVSLSSLRTKSRISTGEVSESLRENEGMVRGVSKMNVRQELDHRRIIAETDRLRPNTAPFPVVKLLRNNDIGPQNIGNFALEGPKRKEENLRNMFRSTSPNPKIRKVLGGLSPKKGWRTSNRSLSPERLSLPMGSIDEGSNGNNLNKSLLGAGLLNTRDQSALKLGRLVLSTVLDQEDAKNEDVLSRFFLDNWLKKSGGEFSKVDTFSIELMSRVQKSIQEAKNAAINGRFSEEDAMEPVNDPSDGNKAGVSEVKDGDVEETAIIDNNSASVNHESLSVEKKAMKLVGLVALEALDTCIAEFGKANPVLNDIRSGLLPLIFADKCETDELNDTDHGGAAETDLDKDKKYHAYQTWVEDSHFMLKSFEKLELRNAKLVDDIAELNITLEDKSKHLQDAVDSVTPLQKSIRDLEQDKECNLAVIEDERAKIAQLSAIIESQNDNMGGLRKQIENGIEREKQKDGLIEELRETIAQMERDRLPDIREEYAAARKEVANLTEEKHDLEDAVRTQKAMLDMAKKADEDAAARIIHAEEEHRDWLKVLCHEGREIQGSLSETAITLKAEFDEANDDQKKAIQRRVNHFDSFFTDSSRAKTSARYVEYLEMTNTWALGEIRGANVEKTNIRIELQRVIDNERQIIEKYEAKLVAQAELHRQEVETLQTQVKALEKEVEEKVVEIQKYSNELEEVKLELTQIKEVLGRAQDKVLALTEDNDRLKTEIERLNAEIGRLTKRVASLEEELLETKEELIDTKKELEETIIDLRETNRQLDECREDISHRDDQLSMMDNDDWMEVRHVRSEKRGDILKGQLEHAKSNIENLKERIEFLNGEVRDLTEEIVASEKAREDDQKEFEIRTQSLHTQIGELELEVSKHLAAIEKRDARIQYLEQERERVAVGYEDTLASDIREADKLQEEVAALIEERNAIMLEKHRLESDLLTMTERAVKAEDHYAGSDELADWFNSELRTLLQKLEDTANNYKEDEFNDDDLDPVVLKMAVNGLEKAKLLEDELKTVAIDLMIHADEMTKVFIVKFKRTIKDLSNSLEVSRKVIQTSNSIGGGTTIQGSSVDDFSIQGGDSTIQDQGSVVSRSSIGGDTNIHRARSRDAYGADGAHLEILQDGWLAYDPEIHALMRVGETPVNTEILQMMREDGHASLHKDAVLDMIFENDEEEKMKQRIIDLVRQEEEEAKEDIERSEEEFNHRIRILETAAAAVEREDPLRERIKAMEAKMAVMEAHEQELLIQTDEALAETKFTKKRNEELLKTFEELKNERDDALAKFEQAMKALHTSKEKSKEKQEEPEKGKAEHPAMRNIKEIINANKGNPKKLVQPFVHFIRRNENEISRHLGTQSVMMREVKHLVESVKEALVKVRDEEAKFYYRKHNSVESNEENISSLAKVWDLSRTIIKDIDDKASWIFETQDFSMGNDCILDALRVPEGSTVDPMRAIGENHLAAAYEAHCSEVQNGGNEELTDIIDEQDAGNENLMAQIEDGLDALASHLRHNSKKSGGWRMELYNLDGSIDLNMPIKDWSTEDKVLILAEKLQFSRLQLEMEKKRHGEIIDALKSQRAKIEEEMDATNDEIARLKKEYGAVGIEHDFFVYKRIKQGILDGSLEKYNLGETIYNPSDFMELETAIFRAVQLLLDLSGRQLEEIDGSSVVEAPQNSKLHPSFTVAFDSKTITPAGDKPPMIVDAPPPGAGPRPSTTGSQDRSISGKYTSKMIALASNKHTKSTRPPRNEWKETDEDEKRKKRLNNYHVKNAPAVHFINNNHTNNNNGGAYSQPKIGANAQNGQNISLSFAWSNEKTKRLVTLLNDACKKISMRVLYAKVMSHHSEQEISDSTEQPVQIAGLEGGFARAPSEKTDVKKFVGAMNTRINKHIQSAKLFESVVREVEEVMEGGGGLDNVTLKRIYDAKMAYADASKEEKESFDPHELVVEKPPASLARSAHLVRGDHHHLVKESHKDRKFMSSTWTGRPSSPGDRSIQQDLCLQASNSTASLGADKMAKYGMLDSRLGVGSSGSHIVSTPLEPRNLSLMPVESWLVNTNHHNHAAMEHPRYVQHPQHPHLGQNSTMMPLDMFTQNTYSLQTQHEHSLKSREDKEKDEPPATTLHLDVNMNTNAQPIERKASISMDSDLSSALPSRRESLESMLSEGMQRSPRVAQWEERLKEVPIMDVPEPSTPEPKSVTMLVKDIHEGSIAESLGSSSSKTLVDIL